MNQRTAAQELRALSVRVARRFMAGQYLTVTPAHGRDYRTKAEVVAAWEQGEDFILRDSSSRWNGLPIDKEGALRAGFTTVTLRFQKERSYAVVKLGSLQREALNKYNAPELMGALKQTLEKFGLGDTWKELKAKGFPQMIEQAWKERVKP